MHLCPRRSSKPTTTWEASLGNHLVVLHKPNEKDKQFSVLGFGTTATILTIHDGNTNSFDSMPAVVKKKFPNTAAIRTFMNASSSSKVYALIIESFQKKGPLEYEVYSQFQAQAWVWKMLPHPCSTSCVESF